MALCAHGMHWPQLSETEHGNMLEIWKMKWWGDASDQECAMIDEATKDMDSIEANHWFCIETPHTVFQRERDFLDTSEAPYERYLIVT